MHPIWGKDHIRLLLNEQATKDNIRDALLAWLGSRADANDVVLFYFAGHGGQHDAHAYISPHDTLPDSYASDVPDVELSSWLDQLKSERVIVMLDSCRSGGFIGELARTQRVIVTASAEDEDAWSYQSLGHGVFTYYVLQGWDEPVAADANGDGAVSVEELFLYAQTQVIERGRGNQHPQLYDGYAAEIALFSVGTGRGSASQPGQQSMSGLFYVSLVVAEVTALAALATTLTWTRRG